MIRTFRGIVIHTLRYDDQRLVVRIFTSEHGLKAFMINDGRSKKKTGSRQMLQPLSMVEFECTLRENKQLNTLRNLRIAQAWQNIPFDTGRSAMVLFLDELLYKTLPDDYTNEALFQYLWNALILLDDSIEYKNFHLWCLLEITRHYGFYPQSSEWGNEYFDMRQGFFVSEPPTHPWGMNRNDSAVLLMLLEKEWPQVQHLELHSSVRLSLLNHLVQYIRLHIENLRDIHSLHVLHEVFH